MVEHVSFEVPIDWRQWKLDKSVRSLRMWLDKDNDLYAVPVVVVDPTGVASNASSVPLNTKDNIMRWEDYRTEPANDDEYIYIDLRPGYEYAIEGLTMHVVNYDDADVLGPWYIESNGLDIATNVNFTYYMAAGSTMALLPAINGHKLYSLWFDPMFHIRIPLNSNAVQLGAHLVTSAVVANRQISTNIWGYARRLDLEAPL